MSFGLKHVLEEKGDDVSLEILFFYHFLFFFLKNGNPVTENVGKGRGGK